MAPNPTPRPYDFAHPHRIGQDQVLTLRTLHQAFARGVAVAFSTRLRSLVEVEVVSVAQETYANVVSEGTSPTASFVAGEVGSQARLLLDLDPRLVVYLAQRLFGGENEIGGDRRALSRIEQRVSVRLIEDVLDTLEEAWAPHAKLAFPLDHFEHERSLAQLVEPDALVAVVRFETRVGKQWSPMLLAYPLSLVESVFGPPRLRPTVRPGDQKVPAPLRACYEATVRTAEVPFACELGRTRLTLDELMDLAPGDIIPLLTQPDEPLVARVGGQPRFRVAAGRAGTRAAVRILDVLTPDPLTTASDVRAA